MTGKGVTEKNMESPHVPTRRVQYRPQYTPCIFNAGNPSREPGHEGTSLPFDFPLGVIIHIFPLGKKYAKPAARIRRPAPSLQKQFPPLDLQEHIPLLPLRGVEFAFAIKVYYIHRFDRTFAQGFRLDI
jgi:hypothetical protein